VTAQQEAAIGRLAADLAAALAQQRERDEAARFADGVYGEVIAELSAHARVSHVAAVNHMTREVRAFLTAHPNFRLDGPLHVTPRAADDLD
jgi:hypothetical protein